MDRASEEVIITYVQELADPAAMRPLLQVSFTPGVALQAWECQLPGIVFWRDGHESVRVASPALPMAACKCTPGVVVLVYARACLSVSIGLSSTLTIAVSNNCRSICRKATAVSSFMLWLR